MSDHDIGEPLRDATNCISFLQDLAKDEVPRLFAVGLVHSERNDAYLAAYGMVLDGYAETISRDGTLRLRTTRPEDVLRYFAGKGFCAHILWLSEAVATADRAAPLHAGHSE